MAEGGWDRVSDSAKAFLVFHSMAGPFAISHGFRTVLLGEVPGTV